MSIFVYTRISAVHSGDRGLERRPRPGRLPHGPQRLLGPLDPGAHHRERRGSRLAARGGLREIGGEGDEWTVAGDSLKEAGNVGDLEIP